MTPLRKKVIPDHRYGRDGDKFSKRCEYIVFPSQKNQNVGQSYPLTIGREICPELTKGTATPESDWNASYFAPVFADIKYSFTETLVTPFMSMKGGAAADITNKGLRTSANPSAGLDIARFSLKVGYEYQLGFWGHLDGKHMHNVKLGAAYTFLSK